MTTIHLYKCTLLYDIIRHIRYLLKALMGRLTLGVAKSHDEATFYRFTHTYLVYVKVYLINIKYTLI